MIKLNVPYSEKELAKQKGALWDSENKTWFIPSNKNLNFFTQWLNTEEISLIANSPFWLAVVQKYCWKCKKATDVIAFASKSFWTYEYCNDIDSEKWLKQNFFSFFSNPVYIEKNILDIVCPHYPTFKIAYSHSLKERYWVNHCKHCNALQGDFFMHEEPGGEFFPLDVEGYNAITLFEIPCKYDLKMKASYGVSTNEKEMFKQIQKTQWKK